MDQLSNYYNLGATEVSAAIVLFNLCFSLVLQFIVIYIYRKTRHGLSYSQSFIFTLMMIGVLSSTVMMIVESNLTGAFALLGVFSLVRFRTIVKETSDIAYVFFSLITGVAVGTGHYAIALITVVFMGIIIYLLQKYAFGSISDNFDYILILKTDKNFNPDSLTAIFDKHIARRELLQVKNFGESLNEIVYSLKFKTTKDSLALLNDLKPMQALKQTELLSGKSTSEY